MKNLILSIADNYTYYDMSRFFITLNRTGFNGHVCLYVGPNTGKRTIAKLKKSGVEVIKYQYEFPFIDNPHPDNFTTLPNPIHLYNYRHFLYYDYLLKNPGTFDKVMLSDIRDVVFQIDPFEFNMEGSICVAMENSSKTIRACSWNGNWMMMGYGEDVMQKYGSKVVSCAGTTYAPSTLMLDYLKAMLEEIKKLKAAFGSVDQAAHNFLIYSGRLKPIKRLYNESGPALTLASEDSYELSPDELLVNRIGQVVNVVHQYDRHKALKKLFNKKVFPWPLQRWIIKRVYLLAP